MKGFYQLIVKKKRFLLLILILVIFISIGLSALMLFQNKINADIFTYFPKNGEANRGITFLEKNFDIKGDSFIVVEGTENDKDINKAISNISKFEGVRMVVSYKTVDDVDKIANLLNITLTTEELREYLKQPIFDKNNQIVGYNHVILLLLDYKPTDFRAFNLQTRIYEEFATFEKEAYISGMVALAHNLFLEMLVGIVLAVIVFAFLRLLILGHIKEFFLISTAIKISSLICLAINFIFPNNLLSIVFGLVINMIFIVLSSKKLCSGIRDKNSDYQEVFSKNIPTILKIALVICVGSMGFLFAEMNIFREVFLAIVINIITSSIFLIFFAPLLFSPLQKRRVCKRRRTIADKEKPAFDWKKTSFVGIIICFALIIPCLIGVSTEKINHTEIYDTEGKTFDLPELSVTLQNQLVMALPTDTISGTNKDFVERLKTIDNVTWAFGAGSLVKESDFDKFKNITALNVDMVNLLFNKVENKYYSLYIIGIDKDIDSKENYQTYKDINALCQESYGESYPFGLLPLSYDLQNIKSNDFALIYIILFLSIIILCSILLKSIYKGGIIFLGSLLSIGVSYFLYSLFQDINIFAYLLAGFMQVIIFMMMSIFFIKDYDHNKISRDTTDALSFTVRSTRLRVFYLCVLFAFILLSVFIWGLIVNKIVVDILILMMIGMCINGLFLVFILPSLLSVSTKSWRKN